ncbi:acetylxylan esterase, partial [Streptomyces olivaceoviridis]
MALFDLPLDELRAYRSESPEPDDFDAFWDKTLQQAREHELDARFEPVETGLSTVEVYDVTFAGFGGHPVKGWLRLPAGATEPLPLVVEFIGYGGGRGLPHESLLWASTGRAHFAMDTRGQGSAWGGGGGTPDPVGAAPAYPGFMTRGIDAPENYYYRRVFTDAVRAVEAARSHPLADPARTAVTGASQGGGIALAVGGLVPDLVAVAPDVPFLCDFPRGTTLTDRHPYREIGLFLKTHRGRSADGARSAPIARRSHWSASSGSSP